MTLRTHLVYAALSSVLATGIAHAQTADELPLSTATPVVSFQGTLPITFNAPRRIATASNGKIFVADSKGKLHLLTKRGEFVATVIEGVDAVAAGGGKVYVATKRAELAT